MTTRNIFLKCIVFGTLLSSGNAWGQEFQAAAPSIEPLEIMLYGATQEISLFELPGSATILSADELQKNASYQLSQALTDLPGINYAGGSNAPRFFQIRGIGEFEQYEGAPNPSVGLIVDDIDFSGLGLPITFFDTMQLEILRGPQGTRYGASALAGLIRLDSNKPKSEYGGTIELGVGNDSLKSAGVAITGPVLQGNDKLLFRLSSAAMYQDGFRNNKFLNSDDTNQRLERNTRLALSAKPSAESAIDLKFIHIDNNDGYDVFTIDNSFTTQSDRPGKDELQANGASLKASLALSNDLIFESTTSVLDANQSYAYDGDWGNNPFWEPYAPYDYEFQSVRERSQFSEELRLRSNPELYVRGLTRRWLLGTYMQRLNEETEISEFADNFQYRDLASEYRAKTYAAFAEYEVPLRKGSAFILGARLEQRDMRYLDSRPSAFYPEDLMWGGSASLTQDLNAQARAYITLARGVKGGGINPGTRIPNEQRIFSPESLISLESGIKGHFFDNRLTTEIAAFLWKRDDAQLKFAFQYDPNDPLAFSYVTSSVAEGENLGLEGRVVYELSPQLSLLSSGAILSTKYTEVPLSNADLDGREQSHAPSWQYSLGVEYQATENWFTRVAMQGKDDFYFDDSHSEKSSAYELLNVSLGYRTPSWSWTVWGRNVLDQKYAVRGFFFGNEPPNFEPKKYVQLGDPISFGTTISIYF
jgi:outer membrane receptor protein involved in Fe transport